MFLSSLTDGGATPAMVKTLAFNEARMKMIANNVANAMTPGYRTKQLDARGFQVALRKALDVNNKDNSKPFIVRNGREVTTAEDGSLRVTPSDKPVGNILFHDGTNASIERQMADLAETGMTHQLVSTLLRGRFDAMRKAIRGTVG